MNLDFEMSRIDCFCRQSLEAHKRVHSGIKAWSCDVCGKLLSSRDSITRHKLVFHQDERPFECEQCGRRFKIKDTLKKHQKTHGERKFKCEVGYVNQCFR